MPGRRRTGAEGSSAPIRLEVGDLLKGQAASLKFYGKTVKFGARLRAQPNLILSRRDTLVRPVPSPALHGAEDRGHIAVL